MKSIALTQTAHRPTDFTLVLLNFLASLLILGFSPNLKAEIRLGDNPISSLSEAHRAVWKIQNIEPHAIFEPRKGDTRGTTFAVAPNLFITNFHIWNGFLYSGRPLTSIYLVQKGSSTALKVQGVHIVSGVYDFVLFQTTKGVNHYLALEHKDFTLKSSDDLSLIGYPRGSFAIADQKQLEGAMVYYEDMLSYGFGTNILDLNGASGGPILNSKGKVIGLFNSSYENVAHGIKVQHLRELTTDKRSQELASQTKRTFCSQPTKPQRCLRAERGNVRNMAKQSDTLALFRMGTSHSHINETDVDWDLSANRLKASAKQGFSMAQHQQGLLHYNAQTDAQDKLALIEFQKAADQGLGEAQYMLAIMHSYELGTSKNNQMARYWAEQSAQAGYDAAEAFLRNPMATRPARCSWGQRRTG